MPSDPDFDKTIKELEIREKRFKLALMVVLFIVSLAVVMIIISLLSSI